MKGNVVFAALLVAPALTQLPPSVTLENAAQAGMQYPMIGLGTAGSSVDRGYGVYPECWSSCSDGQCYDPLPNGGGCSKYAEAAIMSWFQLGGRRIDNANSYHNQDAIGRAVAYAQLPPLNLSRSDIFVQTKVGPNQVLGYNEMVNQTQQVLASTGLSYVDMVLVHWPDCIHGGGCGPSSDPACDWVNGTVPSPTYNATQCKLNSYKALLDIWKNSTSSSGIRAVGVSNFNISDIQDIQRAGYELPAVNQISFHLYHSVAEKPLVQFCQVSYRYCCWCVEKMLVFQMLLVMMMQEPTTAAIWIRCDHAGCRALYVMPIRRASASWSTDGSLSRDPTTGPSSRPVRPRPCTTPRQRRSVGAIGCTNGFELLRKGCGCRLPAATTARTPLTSIWLYPPTRPYCRCRRSTVYTCLQAPST